MKTAPADALQAATAAPIIAVAGVDAGVLDLMGAEAEIERARSFAEPLLAAHRLDSGEPAFEHAQGVERILRDIGASPAMRAAAYLVYAGDFLQRPEEVVRKGFGESHAELVTHTRKLVAIQRASRDAVLDAADPAVQARQLERVRKMLLAFSRDLRVVLMRLASRLQTLRWHAAAKVACPPALALESQQVFAPLANRLGIWQIKWELEDLSFRFLHPADYRHIAALLDARRTEREAAVEAARRALAQALADAGIGAQVLGRPKHIYSIWKKMQGKQLDFAHVFDLRALRVVVDDVAGCYAALALVHGRWPLVDGEYDDYIARPKPNGYQSLHTVVRAADGQPMEVQIRTAAMNRHAEHGMAAHWAYKEAGTRGYAGVSVDSDAQARLALARKAVLQQLLAWERDHASAAVGAATAVDGAAQADDRVYVFTPQAALIELTVGATAVDFAYALHTELGHRCRGARVDGRVVPLNTPLQQGQTVEIVSAREGGPSRDWLNPELGYLASPRSRAKVRAWFNAQAQAQTVARGREAVERLLQREGRTAIKHDELAARLGFKDAAALFEVVGKDELSLKQVEQVLHPVAPPSNPDPVHLRAPKAGDSGVLVVGVESLLTTLSRCCRPAPPDAIGGYVTRGKGVAIHRAACSSFRHMAQGHPERVIPVAWGTAGADAVYPVDLWVQARQRPQLLRDVSEALSREGVHITAVNTLGRPEGQARRDADGVVTMTFTVELAGAARLAAVLRQLSQVPGVQQARRR
ncbi:MAG: RelA/SpoT family protein [Aquabacterium sp.]